MSLFNPCKLTSDKLADLPIKNGQLIVTTDTKKLYVDVSPTTRIEVKSDAEVDLTDYVTQQVLTAALGEEASEREKQDGLLKDLINTKLDTSSADNRYALKNNPELTGDVSITNTGWALGKITAAHPDNDDTDLTYYKYVIGFDSLHRPYFAKYEGETKVSTIYLDSDAIVLDQPIEFTDASGVGSNSSAANQTRINIGAAAANHTHDDKYYTETEVDNLLSSKANTSHTHTAANITDLDDAIAEQIPEIPTKLPNPAALTISLNGTSQGAYDGSAAKSIDVTAASVGAAAATHNHAASAITSGTFSLDRIPTITDAKISGISASKISGTISSTNLPSYVDDVLEYNGQSNFPEEGESGKIYVDTSTNKTYRWSGSGYVEISASLALGTTSSTAFRGDYGNTAYQHATAKGSAYSSGLYKITTNNQGHVTAATAVTKADITGLGIPAQDTNTNTTYTLTKSGSTITLTGSDGSKTSVTDANTTYSLSSFGITATAAELNKLDGCTATVTELNYVDGVTSNIQTQLNGKAASSHTHSYLPLSGGTLTGRLTANKRISAPTVGGSWISGMTVTNATLGISTTNSNGSYHPIIACKTYGGHFWNLGTITNTVGFYGFKSGRTENATDWSFTIDTTTGNVNSTDQITAPTFVGALSGNATTATTATQANYWTTARTLTFTGNVTGSVSVRGNANMSCALTLANDSVTSAKIAANAVTASEIASGAVGLSELSSTVGTVAVQSSTPTDSHVKLWIKV